MFMGFGFWTYPSCHKESPMPNLDGLSKDELRLMAELDYGYKFSDTGIESSYRAEEYRRCIEQCHDGTFLHWE